MQRISTQRRSPGEPQSVASQGHRRRPAPIVMRARLHPTLDADLVTWWQALPSGRAAALLRNAVRQADLVTRLEQVAEQQQQQLAALHETIQTLTTSLARQNEQLAALSAQVDALSQHMHRLTVHGIARLDDELDSAVALVAESDHLLEDMLAGLADWSQ